jgi:hypothetical protein
VNSRTIRAALLAFLLSRAIFLREVYNDRIRETSVVLKAERIVRAIVLTVMNGDTWWYHSIAVSGYERRPFAAGPANWAFFPLYPLTVRVLDGDFALSGSALCYSSAR